MAALQDITYLQLQFASIKDPNAYFNSGGSSMSYLRRLYNNIKLIWGLENNNLDLSVSESQEVYRFSMMYKRTIFGFVIYIPKQKRIDLYTSENVNLPLIQWKNKKVVFAALPLVITKAGLEKLLDRLVQVL